MWTLKEPDPEEHPAKDFAQGRVFYESVVCTCESERSTGHAVPAVPPQPQGHTVWTNMFPAPMRPDAPPDRHIKPNRKPSLTQHTGHCGDLVPIIKASEAGGRHGMTTVALIRNPKRKV